MTATLRVIEGHLVHYRRTWKASAAASFLTPVLFLVAMGMGLGSLVDDGGSATDLPGTNYLTFLAPGLLVASAMQLSAGESTHPVLAGFLWQKRYVAAAATPVSPANLVWGHLGALALRLALSATVFALIMRAFGIVTIDRAMLTVLPAVLTGLAFAALITAVVATTQSQYLAVAIMRFGIMPMFLFSGTFFPVSHLPAIIQPIAYATPLWHGVDLARSVALGTTVSLPPGVSIAYLLMWVLGGTLLGIRAFTRRLAS